VTSSITVIELVQSKDIRISSYRRKTKSDPYMKEQKELLASSDQLTVFIGQAQRTAKPPCLEICGNHEKKMSGKLKGGNFSLL